VFLQPCLQSPFGLSDVDLATAAGDTIHHIGLFTGGALQSGWRTGSPWLLDHCDEEAGREEKSSLTFDLR